MKEAFSSDGYIIDQNYMGEYEYRTISSKHNGCGWMAVYNLRKFLGHDVNFDDVRREMDKMHTIRIPGPTTMKVLREYMKRYVPEARESIGKDAAFTAANASRAGILRYNESSVPHLIAFIRLEGDRFRFFNVEDGYEDCCYTMPDFFKERVLPGYTEAFTIE